VVLRLKATNVQEGKKILMESGLKLRGCETMKDAADKVVARQESYVETRLPRLRSEESRFLAKGFV